MSIVQVRMNLSESELSDIRTGIQLLSGCLTSVESGRVIRRPPALTMRIDAASKAIQFVKGHKTVIIGTIAFIGGAALSFIHCNKYRKYSSMLCNALTSYLEATCNGAVSLTILNNLSCALNAYNDVIPNEERRSLLSYSDIEMLNICVLDYLKRLADANAIVFDDLQVQECNDNVVQLQEYLNAHKRILVRKSSVC